MHLAEKEPIIIVVVINHQYVCVIIINVSDGGRKGYDFSIFVVVMRVFIIIMIILIVMITTITMMTKGSR